jgi:glycosyltransferase involved in cell wall biosynthesis
MSNVRPLVTVGVPVRNGAETLGRALETILNQTYTNLEVLISDNASDDGSDRLCEAYAARDSRVRYHRHPTPVEAWKNFRTPAEASRGEFFMWAAHDDVRDANYVETLLTGFAGQPSSLCFSDAARFTSLLEPEAAVPFAHRFTTTSESTWRDIVRQQTSAWYPHIYGLIRAGYLREYPWYRAVGGWDVVFSFWLALRGPFVKVPGTTFRFYAPDHLHGDVKSMHDNFKPLSAWWPEQLAWACARAAADASERAGGPPVSGLEVFAEWHSRLVRGTRGWLRRVIPRRVVSLYRHVAK